MSKTLLFSFLICMIFSTAACQQVENKPVKGNVLKEYVEVPLDKAKGMKAEVEQRQDKAKDMMDAVDQ